MAARGERGLGKTLSGETALLLSGLSCGNIRGAGIAPSAPNRMDGRMVTAPVLGVLPYNGVDIPGGVLLCAEGIGAAAAGYERAVGGALVLPIPALLIAAG